MDIDSIYRLYFRDVFLFLQGLTHNETLAEELTQETFFKALDGLKDYDDRQDVRAWLFTVARNAYYSHCRRTKHTAPLEDAETAPADTPDAAWETVTTMSALVEAATAPEPVTEATRAATASETLETAPCLASASASMRPLSAESAASRASASLATAVDAT